MYKDFPKKPNGNVDKVALKSLYMESKYVSWAQFCKAYNFNPTSRSCPSGPWVKEKRQKMTFEHGDELKEALEEGKREWSKNVAKFILNAPKRAESCVQAIAYCINQVLEEAQDEQRIKQAGGKVDRNDNVLTRHGNRLVGLANALAIAQNAQRESMLLDKFNLKLLEEIENPQTELETKDGKNNITFEVMTKDGESIDAFALQKMLVEYYDKPVQEQISADETGPVADGGDL